MYIGLNKYLLKKKKYKPKRGLGVIGGTPRVVPLLVDSLQRRSFFPVETHFGPYLYSICGVNFVTLSLKLSAQTSIGGYWGDPQGGPPVGG